MSTEKLREVVGEIAGDLVALRRALHREPEVGLELPATQARILDALAGLGLEVTTGRGLSSVVAVLRGGAPPRGAASDRRVVLLRGDMDALPVAEQTGLEFASTNGAMHACGHDLHVSLLVGAARALCAVRDELAGDVVFMFQPGEEGDGGAEIMIEEGLLEAAGRRPDAAYAIHVFSALEPYGTFATRPGPMMAAADEVDVRMIGRGGHGSAPHLAADPVPALADLVGQWQTHVGRTVDIFDPAVVTVGAIHAGEARNVIPESGELKATVRTFSRQRRERLWADLPRVAEAVAAAHDVRAEVVQKAGYPVTANDPASTADVLAALRETFGEGRVAEWAHPLTGSEDFSYVLERVPGTFIGLSACPPDADPAEAPYNHSAYAVFDDGVLADGALCLAELARRALA